jgi:hypothetical protein
VPQKLIYRITTAKYRRTDLLARRNEWVLQCTSDMRRVGYRGSMLQRLPRVVSYSAYQELWVRRHITVFRKKPVIKFRPESFLKISNTFEYYLCFVYSEVSKAVSHHLISQQILYKFIVSPWTLQRPSSWFMCCLFNEAFSIEVT